MIRKLTPFDADTYIELRREALTLAPFAFAASLTDDAVLSAPLLREALGTQTQAIFGAFGPDLAGVVGIYREAAVKTRHKARLWGLYVRPAHRGQRLGRQLVEAALTFARGLEGVHQVHLGVADRATEARALYAALGFQTWGVEPRALQVGEEAITEYHMVLPLVPGAA
ncbi:MAG TPA: GNAT family N-acetyltransferase [Gemmatimonadales bacterium]|nr:GNAT family N-acetyltransferase [Gemmatimonadales bacterium]